MPAIVIIGVLALVFAVRPGGGEGAGPSRASGPFPAIEATEAVPSPSPAPSATPASPATPTSEDASESDVVGLRETLTIAPSPTPDLAAEGATQCGSVPETTVDLSVEQTLSGVSLRATRASVYPVEGFACILRATGGAEAGALAAALERAEIEGATHAVIIDLWITNGGVDLAQINFQSASIAAAGLTFSPLATLGGRAEVVIATGQRRALTLLVAPTNAFGDTTGPMTLIVEPPLIGGEPAAGRYQLFLPTP